MGRRRKFGWVRRLPSGRYQASFVDPLGMRRYAPRTFERKPEASDWLTVQEALIVRGEWSDPDRGKVPFGPYAARWIAERPGLRPRTRALYGWLLNKYLDPTFGKVLLADIDPPAVRRWRSQLLEEQVSASMVAKAYRLMRAVMNTAVEQDELVRRNPCRIKGGGEENPSERPVLSVREVLALAASVPERFSAMILVTTFGSLRFGEVTALTRSDVSLERGTLRVRRAFSEVKGQGLVTGPPKSRAGVRTVSLPQVVVDELRRHLDTYVAEQDDALVFTGPKGSPIRRGNFNKLVQWEDTVGALGRLGLHFHDLRHTGNTLAAGAGGSTRDLMTRMGHDSMHAALVYQHATTEADRAIADALEERLRQARAGQEELFNPGDEGHGESA